MHFIGTLSEIAKACFSLEIWRDLTFAYSFTARTLVIENQEKLIQVK